MKNVDLYWRSNKEWWEFRNHIPVIKKDAPKVAQESYNRYLKQMKDK